MTKKRPVLKIKSNPYDLHTVFEVAKKRSKKKHPKNVNPYDCSGSAQYGRFSEYQPGE